ncbi:interleukin-6 receptor subunit beta [Centropristis striata]|uniref:interleukin-6 receptor subunit beta n=1 Tax=Centropristis striata TaxID=184440 RepID=UPI0027E16578|nr:interleukin-6 receptor subunit beta [Centropristis striata]
MDVWSAELQVAVWTLLGLCVCCHEVTVRDSDLKRCEDDQRACVTHPRDCRPPPPQSIQKTLNMSCSYQSLRSHKSVTCGWSQDSDSRTQSDASLIFSSDSKILSCQGIFVSAAVLNITARIKNYMMGGETWSQPHTVFLYDAIKPSQPVLSVLGSTEDSVIVSWRSSSNGDCRLRYRADSTHIWTQAPGSVPAHRDQTLTFTIKDLLAFTVYRAAVACRRRSGIWSNWSEDVSARTLDRVPSEPPEVCYRVEKTDSDGSFLLHLMWKDLDLCDGRARVLGYQVIYEKLQHKILQNVTEVMALLVVEEGNCSVTVRAFNTAGYGPAARLSIDTHKHNALPSVSHLWVSSSFPSVNGLLVQWESPAAPPSVPPVSHLAVRWRSETRPSISRWTTVDRLTTSTLIQEVDPDVSYLISVFPVYQHQFGCDQSLPAALQQGALMEAVQLKVVGVTRTTVTATWLWQRKSGPIRVERYSVMLRKDSERRTLSLWPDQQQLTFHKLKPDTEYSLLLLADDDARNIIPVRTNFDELPAVAAATPLLLLAATVVITSVLARTVYKWYFFPPISSPRGSATGQWLMDQNHQKTAERNILDMEDFQVTDVLGEKSLIVVGLNSSEEDLHEDSSLLSTSRLIIKLSALELDTEYISDCPVTTELPLVSLPSSYTEHPVNHHHPEAAAALLCHTHEASSRFPQKEEETGQANLSETKSHFSEFTGNRGCVYQMSCEDDYVLNSSFLRKTEV